LALLWSFGAQNTGTTKNIKPHPPSDRERELFACRKLRKGSDPAASGYPEDRDMMVYVLRERLREWFSGLFGDDVDNWIQELKDVTLAPARLKNISLADEKELRNSLGTLPGHQLHARPRE
jgi:hypothetical protein